MGKYDDHDPTSIAQGFAKRDEEFRGWPTGNVVAFNGPLPVDLTPEHRERVVELAAEWGMSTAQAAARIIACYIEAEADA